MGIEAKRKQWKKNSKNYREKKSSKQNLDMDDIQQPTSNRISNSTPETSQAKAGRHRILRKRSKTVLELNETKHHLLIQKSRAE